MKKKNKTNLAMISFFDFWAESKNNDNPNENFYIKVNRQK